MGAFDYNSNPNKPVGFADNGSATELKSAGVMDIWSGQGSLISVTGASNVTGFLPAPQAGSRRTLYCKGTPKFILSSSLLVQGGVDYQSFAGDIIEVVAITTTTFSLAVIRGDGNSTGNFRGKMFFATSN